MISPTAEKRQTPPKEFALFPAPPARRRDSTVCGKGPTAHMSNPAALLFHKVQNSISLILEVTASSGKSTPRLWIASTSRGEGRSGGPLEEL